jgi:hypothetical protein
MRGITPALAVTALLLLAVASRLHRWPPRQESFGLALARASAGLQPGPRPLALLQGDLLERLQQADEIWKPRAEPLPGGGTRYTYRRRPGDPSLTIAQLRVLIANPPTFEAERRSIISLLTLLDQLGTSVSLSQPLKRGAAGEWDPGMRRLRIRPDVRTQGTLQFARVLNHEAIHVAQSCAAGGLEASPRPLGLALPEDQAMGGSGAGRGGPDGDSFSFRQLQNPIYANISATTRQAEREAYALQDRLGLGERLVRIHCSGDRSR